VLLLGRGGARLELRLALRQLALAPFDALVELGGALPERALVGEQRDRHQSARDVAGALRGLAGEAGILADVVDHERLPRHEHPAGDARAGRESLSDQRRRAFPGDCLEDELVRFLVEEENRRRLRAEDRARRLDDRLQQRSERLLRSEHARCDGRAKVVSHRGRRRSTRRGRGRS
jgi:hypothetical protein